MAETASKSTNAPTSVPTNKVISGGVWGSTIVIVVWVLKEHFNITIPADVSAAATVIASSIASYFTRPSTDQTTM
jgi:hypothetical protein